MMKRKEKRIKERYKCLMKVGLVLKEGVDGCTLAGPAKGSFCNISSGGAAVIVDQVEFGDCHLVESSLADPNKVLELDVMNDMVILSRATWFHPVTVDGEKKFRVGVEFMKTATEEELTEMMSIKNEEEKPAGWRGIVGKLFP